jgi:Fe-S-cluster containining protein
MGTWFSRIEPMGNFCESCGRCCDKFPPEPIAPALATGIEAEVCADIAARQRKGIAKYGMTVAQNPLELQQWLQHAYEEVLDQAVYLKRAIAKIQKNQTP